MQGLNKAILIGTVDEVPKLHGGGGRTRLSLRIRTVETYTDESGATRERRAWHDVVVWGRLAEALAPYLARGSSVAIEGRIVSSSWNGADGKRRWRTEIHANELVLLDRRRESVPHDPPSARDVA